MACGRLALFTPMMSASGALTFMTLTKAAGANFFYFPSLLFLDCFFGNMFFLFINIFPDSMILFVVFHVFWRICSAEFKFGSIVIIFSFFLFFFSILLILLFLFSTHCFYTNFIIIFRFNLHFEIILCYNI